MSLINPAILFGLGLAAIPVLLHLLMRSKPKKLLFPALRLLQIRRKTNTRRMRLKHIWLMLLRIAVIALIVLAIARPSLPAANYGPNLYETLMTLGIAAAVLAAYLLTVRTWRRRQMAGHMFAYRRSFLRSGAGVAAFLLFLLLVVWPYQRRISAEITSPLPNVGESLPVAAVFLFDTSLSMQYRYENNTRLQRAQEIAGEHRSNLPPGSRVAVTDTSDDSPILFQADLPGAQDRIDSLQVGPVHVPLNDRLRDAVNTQEDDFNHTLDLQESVPEQLRTDRFLREVYVFTDMARSSWRQSGSQSLAERLAALPWLHIYFIDVGVEQPTNTALSELRLSRETLPRGGDLIVGASVSAEGQQPGAERIVELYVENENGKLVKQGQQPAALEAGTAVDVSFDVQGIEQDVTHGELRLITSDPMPGDDIRYFTVASRPPPEILLVAESSAEARNLRFALAPPQLDDQGKARFRVDERRPVELGQVSLDNYDVVCLINVKRPSDAAWTNLAEYVRSGGGLAVFLGMPNERVRPAAAAYNTEVAQSFLPAELLAELKFTPPEYLDPTNLTHPIFRKFEEFGVGELTDRDVRRYWRVEPAADAAVIARYTDGREPPSPAIVERVYGQGRTVMMTTAVDLENEWNDLPRVWAFVAFADQLMQHLSRRAASPLNYIAGQDAVVATNPEADYRRALLRKPRFQQLPIQVPARAGFLTIDTTDQVGHYDLIADNEQSTYIGGFSVNSPDGESDFTRASEADLDKWIGEDRYRIARSTEVLERFITEGRLGREVYSLLLAVVVLAFFAEHFVANRFYDSEQAVTHQ